MAATPVAGFGSLCLNANSTPNSFTLSSTVLTAANVNIAALSDFAFSTSASGPFTPTLTITQPGGPFSQQIFIQFTPTLAQAYNTNVVISGGGAPAFNVHVTGTGINTPPSVSTGTSNVLTPNRVVASGMVTDIGCSPITQAGIEYSSYGGFPDGTAPRTS